MKNITPFFGFGAIVIVLGLLGASDSNASVIVQAPGLCVDATSPDLIMYRDAYADMVSDPDTAAARQRTNFGLPLLDSTQVVIVADSVACQAASIAYDNALGISKPTVPVMVLQLVTKRIVIKDIDWEGPALNILFNQDFTQVLERIWY
jgi:hypothetical protein